MNNENSTIRSNFEWTRFRKLTQVGKSLLIEAGADSLYLILFKNEQYELADEMFRDDFESLVDDLNDGADIQIIKTKINDLFLDALYKEIDDFESVIVNFKQTVRQSKTPAEMVKYVRSEANGVVTYLYEELKIYKKIWDSIKLEGHDISKINHLNKVFEKYRKVNQIIKNVVNQNRIKTNLF